MNTTTCPNCGVILFPGELRDGECTSCMRPLPPPVEVARPGWRFGDGFEDVSLAGTRDLEQRDGTGWGTVRLGLDVLKVSLVLQMASVILGLGLQVAEWVDHRLSWHYSIWYSLSAALLFFGVVLSVLLWLVGLALSATAPRRSGLRGWVMGYLACLGMTFFLGIGSIVISRVAQSNQMWEMRDLAELGLLPTAACGLTCALLFFLYLRGVAQYFRAKTLGTFFLIYLIVTTSLALFGVIVATALSYINSIRYHLIEFVRLEFACVTMLISFVLMGCLWVLLRRLRRVIPRAV